VMGGDGVNDTPDPGPIPDTLDELRAECAALEAQSFETERFHRSTALWIARVATGDLAELAAFIAKDSGEQARGLLVRGGGDALPFATNPWGITGSDLHAALATIWEPIAHLAPAFVARLQREVLALALLGTPEAPSLGYLLMWERGRYELGGRRLPRRRDLATLRDWIRCGSLTVVVADAPRPAGAPARVPVRGLDDV
jgi:hypothetical protein